MVVSQRNVQATADAPYLQFGSLRRCTPGSGRRRSARLCGVDADWIVEVVPLGADLMIIERLGEVETGTTTGLLPSAEAVFGVGSLDEHGLVFTVSEAADAVEVRLASGDVERPLLAQVPDSPAKYFAMPLRPGQQPLLVVAFTGSGDEIARRKL
jgi:hypothetical protein